MVFLRLSRFLRIRLSQNSEITMEGAPALHGGEVELDLGGHFLPEPSVTGYSFSPFGNVAEPQDI